MNLRTADPGHRTYRTQTTYAQPGGLMLVSCWSNLSCSTHSNCCCGGWAGGSGCKLVNVMWAELNETLHGRFLLSDSLFPSRWRAASSSLLE